MSENSFKFSSESECKSVISDYIVNKPRKLRYAVNYSCNVCGVELTELKEFTDEQLEMIHAINQKSKEDLPLWVVLEEYDSEKIDFLKADSEDDDFHPLLENIELDNPYSVYKFK